MNFEQVVPVKEIEPTLTKILGEMQGKNKTRACLFNLLIYTKENTREKYIQQVMQKIVFRFPCRILLFIDKGSAPMAIRSTVSVIEINSGETPIFCDCIQFEMSTLDLNQITYLTLPHLMPDLPTYMLWAEDPFKQDPLPYQLEKFCSRVIFDSEVADQLVIFAKTLLRFQVRTNLTLSDLNWARVESFRDLLIQLFFSKKQANNPPTAIEITYNDRDSPFFCHHKIQAIYLGIDLALRFKMQFEKVDEEALIFKREQQLCKITLKPSTHDTVTAGRILSLSIDLPEDEHYHLKRKESNPSIVVIYRTEKTFCEIPSEYLLAAEDSGASLTDEIFHPETSQHFLAIQNFIAHQPLDNFCI